MMTIVIVITVGMLGEGFDACKRKSRQNVIAKDAMREVMAKDVSEDVNVDEEVVVENVVVEDVEDEQVDA